MVQDWLFLIVRENIKCLHNLVTFYVNYLKDKYGGNIKKMCDCCGRLFWYWMEWEVVENCESIWYFSGLKGLGMRDEGGNRLFDDGVD